MKIAVLQACSLAMVAASRRTACTMVRVLLDFIETTTEWKLCC